MRFVLKESYIGSIKRYCFYRGKRHPREVEDAEVEAFPNHLAVEQQVAASTQTRHSGPFSLRATLMS